MSIVLDPRHVLLLRAALLDGDEARDAFQQWRRDLVWDEIDASTQRVLPLLHRNLVTLGVDDPLLPRLQGLRRRAWVFNEFRLDDIARALVSFHAEAIDSALLKGAAMVVRWLQDPGLRVMGDLDVLVRRHDAHRALSCLLDAGWRPVTGSASRFTDAEFDREHAVGLRSAAGTELDLHWRALREGAAKGDEVLWTRVEPVAIRGHPTTVLSAEDHVFHACAHGWTWSAFGRFDWLADVAVILQASGPVFDWDRVAELAAAERLEVPVGALLRQLDVIGIAVPHAVRRRLLLARPALLDRVELGLRRRQPHELGRVGEAVLVVQDHRRRAGRRPAAGVLTSLAAQRWRVDGTRAAFGYAAYAATGRSARLRRVLLGRDARRRAIEAADLPVVTPGTVVDIADLEAGLLAGWSFPEEAGRWTNAREAILALRLGPAPKDDLPVRVTGSAFVHDGHRRSAAEVWCGDARVASWTFAVEAAWAPTPFLVPHAALGPDGVVALGFVLRAPRRPLADGLSNDDRALGLFVRSVQLGRPAAEPPAILGVEALWEGWTEDGPASRWSDGETAVVRFRVPGAPRPLVVELQGEAFVWPDGGSASLSVRARGHQLLSGTSGELLAGGTLRVVVPPSAIGDGGDVDLVVHLDGTRSPAEVGLHGERRRLGLRIHSVTVAPG